MFFNWNGELQEKGVATFKSNCFKLGFGLIETMVWKDNQIELWENHENRLYRSAERLGVDNQKLKDLQFCRQVQDLILKNKISKPVVLRLQLSFENNEINYVLEVLPIPLFSNEDREVGIATGIALNFDAFSDLKTSSRIKYELAKVQKNKASWYDALLLNNFGRIAESTISNIFWIKGRKIFTPPLSEGCIAGILREKILKSSIDYFVEERPFELEDLRKADELFLTNSVRGIQPIHIFQGKHFKTFQGEKLKSYFK